MSDRRIRNSTLSRRTPLKASGMPASKAKKKTPEQRKRDRVRKARAFARKYHSLERVFFVQMALQCAVPGCDRYPCVNAHILGTAGMGLKAGYRTIGPLCLHHETIRPDSFHELGSQRAFEARHGVDCNEIAARTERAWRRRGAAWVLEAKADGVFDEWLNRRAS